ncbi:MAG: endonuclease MutS2 [Clostridia bacterium]|nr:endonuclease MutS2 [Clostridia bacterium]
MNKKTLKILEFDKILEKLASYAVGEEAKEMCLKLSPSADEAEIKSAISETTDAQRMTARCSSPAFSALKPVSGAIKRAEIGSVLNIPELILCGKVMQSARVIKSYGSSDKFEQETSVSSYFNMLIPDKKFEDTIFGNLIGENEIADSASPELNSIRKQMRRANDKIRDILNNMIHSSKYSKALQDSIVTMRGDRYVIPVKAEHKGEVSGIVHDTSSSGSTLFVEPAAVVAENNRLRELEGMEADEITKILEEYTGMVNGISEIIMQNYKILTALDFIFAKAKLSDSMNACPPEIGYDKYINLKKARHPLLDPKKVVPVDVRLGKDFDSLIITGPNTGGKTVVLKTLGLLSVMAQAGLHVPADFGSTLRIYEDIFADIGDEQSIEQSLSTFSAHMKTIVYITKHLSDRCLILFDELGAGTDPTEGAALAISIIENARRSGAHIAATTHYSELKIYALTTDFVTNASCEFDVETLRPTYRLLIGIPGKSNAFAISSKLGLPKEIVDEASSRLSDENVKFEDVLTDLEKKQKQIDSDAETMARLKREIESIKKTVAHEKDTISGKADVIIEKARAEAKRILLQAKEESDGILDEVRRMKNNSAKISQKEMAEVKTRLNQKLNDVSAVKTAKKKKGGVKINELKVGSTVEVIELNQTGTVLTIPKNGDNKVTVQVGLMKMHLTLNDIALCDDIRPEKPSGYVRGGSSNLRFSHVSSELDLRGMTLDDAELMTEKFIDDAVLASLHQVTIIHGKGTGVLRAGIQKLLKSDKRVKSFRLGNFGEGESGVTIVEL